MQASKSGCFFFNSFHVVVAYWGHRKTESFVSKGGIGTFCPMSTQGVTDSFACLTLRFFSSLWVTQIMEIPLYQQSLLHTSDTSTKQAWHTAVADLGPDFSLDYEFHTQRKVFPSPGCFLFYYTFIIYIYYCIIVQRVKYMCLYDV